MTRLELINTLKSICPVLQPAKLKKQVTQDCIVVYRARVTTSLSNSLCGWDAYDLVLLVPEASIIALDILYNKVQSILSSVDTIEMDYENFLEEQYDETLNAYYRTIRVRFPSQLNKF